MRPLDTCTHLRGLASLIPFHLQTWSCQQPCRLTNTFFTPLSQAKTCTHDATSPLPHHKKCFFRRGFQGRGTKLFKAQKDFFWIMPRNCISHTFAKALSQCALWVCASRKNQRTRVPGSVMSLKFSSCTTQSQRSRAVCSWPRLKTASPTAMRRRKLVTKERLATTTRSMLSASLEAKKALQDRHDMKRTKKLFSP